MLCSTGEEGFDLLYDSLTSESAKTALAEQIKNSQAFFMTLSQAEPMGVENDEDSTGGDQEDFAVEHGEINSSETLDEAIGDLMAIPGADDLLDEVCVGTDLEQFIGHEFSAQDVTTAWIKCDAKRNC